MASPRHTETMAAPHSAPISGRERLLLAAGDLFATHGYAEASVGQVLQAAGVQAPTLYHHFGDKEGLYVAWALSAWARLGSDLLRYISHEPREAMEGFARVIIECRYIDIPAVLRDAKHLGRAESGESVTNGYYEQVFEPLCGVLVRGMEEGVIRPGAIDRMADVFLGGALAFSGALGRGTSDSIESALWLVESLLDGLRP
jgi:AcrR family transcriptional regulator